MPLFAVVYWTKNLLVTNLGKSYINKCATEKLGVDFRDKAVEDLSQKMLEKITENVLK